MFRCFALVALASATMATANTLRVVSLSSSTVASPADTSKIVTLKANTVYDYAPKSADPVTVVVQCPAAKSTVKGFTSYVRISGTADGVLNVYNSDRKLVSSLTTADDDAAGNYQDSMAVVNCINGRLAAVGLGLGGGVEIKEEEQLGALSAISSSLPMESKWVENGPPGPVSISPGPQYGVTVNCPAGMEATACSARSTHSNIVISNLRPNNVLPLAGGFKANQCICGFRNVAPGATAVTLTCYAYCQ